MGNMFYIDPIHQEREAVEVAKVLLRHIINNKEIIAYSDLAKQLSFPINPRNLDRPLGLLSETCEANGFPLASVMVVNKSTYFPGDGFFKWFFPHLKREEWDAQFIESYNEVKQFSDWDVALKAYENV